ncbi:uncharacterized protein A4U43_C07F22620 [Asparagus officinalis]|uniref:Epidermal patterning factor-like protein n=1 Tax=Asparagus officinalis TaxID=4686 RepID=A0A5P1EJA1_ASPOF|nr:protein EPIDERMAL PATTERNING FACTOR 1-like [Asparagus officinalis]XP_020274013.1 protein EPIDERMAL PATTERNING FACTOR 1-like [Asparagus officinalis]ONK64150.1 uncharacterized protein A4U43_C07F22620 [Asparagus officinalis]
MVVPTRAVFLFTLALLMISTSPVLGRQASQAHHRYRQGTTVSSELEKNKSRHEKPYTLQIAGSKLPDCSHACGSCTPCRLVMVSYVCATIQEAETCPMAYKCMCKSKAYPVP